MYAPLGALGSVLMASPQVLFIGVMSDMYVLWDVVGESPTFLSPASTPPVA